MVVVILAKEVGYITITAEMLNKHLQRDFVNFNKYVLTHLSSTIVRTNNENKFIYIETF